MAEHIAHDAPHREGSRIALLAPVPAIVVGAVVAAAHGVSWAAFVPNAIAVVLGAAFVVLAGKPGSRAAVVMPVVAVLAMLATFAGPGVDGVHRWVSLGGPRVGASMAFAPWILLGLAAGSQRARTVAIGALLVAQAIHVVQPDAGQSTVLVAGALPLLLDRRRLSIRVGLPVAFAAAALAGVAWTIDDPLAPVDHVERVLVLGGALGPAYIVAMLCAGAALTLPFVVVMRTDRPLALATGGASLCGFVVTAFGEFPVPVFGAGAGSVLGWYALLATSTIARR